MFTLRCTKQLLDRMGHPVGTPEPASTGLGDGYATALFWKPQMALLVNERTLLPVVLPLAPSARLAQRFPGVLKEILQTLDLPAELIDLDIEGMNEVVYAKTASRSVVGMMNEFAFLAEAFRGRGDLTAPLALSVKLAAVPCGPLSNGASGRKHCRIIQRSDGDGYSRIAISKGDARAGRAARAALSLPGLKPEVSRAIG